MVARTALDRAMVRRLELSHLPARLVEALHVREQIVKAKRKCTVTGCLGKYYARQRCAHHYHAHLKDGTLPRIRARRRTSPKGLEPGTKLYVQWWRENHPNQTRAQNKKARLNAAKKKRKGANADLV